MQNFSDINKKFTQLTHTKRWKVLEQKKEKTAKNPTRTELKETKKRKNAASYSTIPVTYII